MEMDEFGDRQMDFAVWDMTNVESGEFQVKHLIPRKDFPWAGRPGVLTAAQVYVATHFADKHRVVI